MLGGNCSTDGAGSDILIKELGLILFSLPASPSPSTLPYISETEGEILHDQHNKYTTKELDCMTQSSVLTIQLSLKRERNLERCKKDQLNLCLSSPAYNIEFTPNLS